MLQLLAFVSSPFAEVVVIVVTLGAARFAS
jgi:hypothetical protein